MGDTSSSESDDAEDREPTADDASPIDSTPLFDSLLQHGSTIPEKRPRLRDRMLDIFESGGAIPLPNLFLAAMLLLACCSLG